MDNKCWDKSVSLVIDSIRKQIHGKESIIRQQESGNYTKCTQYSDDIHSAITNLVVKKKFEGKIKMNQYLIQRTCAKT